MKANSCAVFFSLARANKEHAHGELKRIKRGSSFGGLAAFPARSALRAADRSLGLLALRRHGSPRRCADVDRGTVAGEGGHRDVDSSVSLAIFDEALRSRLRAALARGVGAETPAVPARSSTFTPAAVLLHGPAGSGKTSLLRAVAGSIGAPLV